jgi:hypothetical protein
MARSPYYYGGGQASTAYVPVPPPQLPGFTAAPSTFAPYVDPTPTDPYVPPEDSGDGGGDAPSPPPAPPVAQALAAKPFDYTADPGYLAALAAQQAQSQQADAALRAAQEAAIVQFGDPSLAQALGITLNPLTAAAAQQNTQSGTSTLAQLQRQRDLNQQGIVNSLAAHGIIRSGDLGYKTGQNEQNYGNELYNAQQGLLGTLAQRASDTAAQKAGLQTGVTNALTSAYQTYVQNPQFWGAATNDGGSAAAMNQQAINSSMIQPPDTASMNRTVSPIAVSLAKQPVSRLAATPRTSPYAYKVALNSRY